MVDQSKEQDQIDIILRNLHLRPIGRLVGIPFQDFKSLVQATFNVEENIAKGLWTHTTPSQDGKGKKAIGLPRNSRKVNTISYQQQRTAYHLCHKPSIIKPHFPHPQYQYQSAYVQQPFIAQTNMQTRPPYLKVTVPHIPKSYVPRPTRQFTSWGMALTRAFKKLQDVGLTIPLAPHPLTHLILPQFHLHEPFLYPQTQRHEIEISTTLHHAIQNLIDVGVVNLSKLSVITNPLPTHFTYAVPFPPRLQQIDVDVGSIDGYGILRSSRLSLSFNWHGYITL